MAGEIRVYTAPIVLPGKSVILRITRSSPMQVSNSDALFKVLL